MDITTILKCAALPGIWITGSAILAASDRIAEHRSARRYGHRVHPMEMGVGCLVYLWPILLPVLAYDAIERRVRRWRSRCRG